MSGNPTVFGAKPGVDVLVCADCRELKKRTDELPPEAA